jgi:hypothetical protein
MEKSHTLELGAVDDEQLALLSKCLLDVHENLIANGVKNRRVEKLMTLAAVALLFKASQGEDDPKRLLSYAMIRVWSRYWHTDRSSRKANLRPTASSSLSFAPPR